jgi:hypothetical protein
MPPALHRRLPSGVPAGSARTGYEAQGKAAPSRQPYGLGGTQPVHFHHPTSPASPSARANASHKPSSSPPPRNSSAPASLSADLAAPERDARQPDPQSTVDEQGNRRSAHPANYYGSPAGAGSISQVRAHESIASRSSRANSAPLAAAASGSIGAQLSSSQPPVGGASSRSPSGKLDDIPQIFDEPSSTSGNSAEGATQVYRPRLSVDLQIQNPAVVYPTPKPKPKPSGLWTFLLGAITFLLVGFVVVAAIMRYLGGLP